MKLTVTQENLSRALNTVSRIATSRGSLPVLANVLLKTKDNQLHLETTNLDVAISEVIGAKVSKEGTLTVPAKLLQDYVSSLPAGTLTLQVEGTKLQIKTDHHSSSVNGTPADDFPEMPTIKQAETITLKAEVLKRTLQQVLFAASSDEARPVLGGMYLYSVDGYLYAVATDSYRLAEKRVMKTNQDIALLLPAHSLQEVLRIMRDDNDSVTISYGDEQARFSIGSVELVTRLIEGDYPDYRRLLPKQHETDAVMKRSDLQEITKVSSLFAREAAGGITVTIEESEKQVSIRSIASQVGENTAIAEAKVTGDAVITMNSRYIMDALNAFDGDNITMQVSGKLDPCVLINPDNDDYLHVVMPVKS
jgi:DNA polymerase-3 subunit beta